VATPTPTAVAAFGTDRTVDTETDEMAALASLMNGQSCRPSTIVPNEGTMPVRSNVRIR
jgi:hypothetical protein